MLNPRAAISHERRRYVRIRRAFEAGLAQGISADAKLTDFYLSCAAYVVFALDRLHCQDQMIHDLLVARIPVDDTSAHQRLSALNERQNSARLLVEDLQCATNLLQIDGEAKRHHFEETAQNFNVAIAQIAEVRKNPFEAYTDTLFTDHDWVNIADTSDASVKIEQNLYRAVRHTAPAGIDPDQMEVVYH